MGEGLVLVIAGLLLILPGFATDAIGLACLFPPVRRRLLTPWMRSQRRRNMGRPGPGASRAGTTLEGEYRREDEGRPERGRRNDDAAAPIVMLCSTAPMKGTHTAPTPIPLT